MKANSYRAREQQEVPIPSQDALHEISMVLAVCVESTVLGLTVHALGADLPGSWGSHAWSPSQPHPWAWLLAP